MVELFSNIWKRYERFITFNNLLILFFAAIFGGLAALWYTFSLNNEHFHKSNYWVEHTHNVLIQSFQVSSLEKDMLLEGNNYIQTGDTSSLQAYLSIRKNLLLSLPKLKEQIQDNPDQKERVEVLQMRVDSFLSYMAKAVERKNRDGFGQPGVVAIIKEGKALRHEINDQLNLIQNEELKLLGVRQNDNNRTIETAYRFLFVSVILIFILLGGAFLLTFYHFRQRRKAEVLMKESEARFRVLVTSIKDLAIYIIDEHGIILNWYPGATQVKGYRTEEVIGKSNHMFYPEDSIDAGEPEYNLRMAATHGSYKTEGWRKRKDGTRFWADVLMSALYDEMGDVQGYAVISRDFSLHKKAEDEVKKALEQEKELNEMKSNFVSIASHEFRTPLSTILSSVSLLEQYRTTETQDKRDRHIQRIKSSVRELVSILDEFLSLEKIEEGKVHPVRKQCNLRDLIQQIEAEFYPILRPGQQILVDYSGEEQVYADPAFLQHMITNLVSNASKYSRDGQMIEITANVNSAAIEISVCDHGIGIAPADQKSLFGRFFRAANAGAIQGTGLGLHIVKRYADLLGGIVRVKSELGKGSTFIITLPRLQTGQAVEA